MERGAEARARPTPAVSAPGAGGQRRSLSARELRGASGSWDPVAEADTWITLSRRLPDVGMGKGEGLEIARAHKSFLSPLRSQDFTSLYGQRGKK
ncbi:hypothetical protein NN561_018301 [Cricetulus griseus]